MNNLRIKTFGRLFQQIICSPDFSSDVRILVYLKSTWTKVSDFTKNVGDFTKNKATKFANDVREPPKIIRKHRSLSEEYSRTERLKSPDRQHNPENIGLWSNSMPITDCSKVNARHAKQNSNPSDEYFRKEHWTPHDRQHSQEDIDLRLDSVPIGDFAKDNARRTKLQVKGSSDFSKDGDISDKNSGGDPENHLESKGETEDDTDKVILFLYTELMKNRGELTVSEWRRFGEERIDGTRFLATRWPTVLLNYIAHREISEPGLFDAGLSLAEYVKSLSNDRSKVMHMVSLISICVNQGGPERYDQALSYYDELRAFTDVLDSSSTRLLVRSLAKTSRWQECFELLKMTELSSEPSSSHYEPIVVAALQHGTTSIADEQLQVLYAAGLVPSQEFFAKLVDFGFGSYLLKILNRYRWIINKSVADTLVQGLNSTTESWQGQSTSVDRSGRCRTCRIQLDPLPRLSDEEFLRLRTTFMTESFARSGNIFINSNPRELEVFLAFVEKNGPFDVVLDGLNIAFKTFQKSSVQQRDSILSKVIQFFCLEKKSVMVLGRKHMRTWRSAQYKPYHGHINWFFTDNVSSDDPFMLYTALYSGQETMIVTNDQLRDHRFLLGSEVAELLKVWQRGHQVLFNGLHVDKATQTERPSFQWPNVHDTFVQTSPNGWHVPFNASPQKEGQRKRNSFQLPDTWYCLQKH